MSTATISEPPSPAGTPAAGAVQVASPPSWWGGTPSPSGASAAGAQDAAGVSTACLTHHAAGATSAAGGGLPAAWGSPASGDGTGPVWGGRGPSTRPAAREASGTPAAGSRLGVQVAPAPTPGQGTGSGQGPAGEAVPGAGGPQDQRRRRRTLREWWWSPIHDSPDPAPRWLAQALLAYRSAGTGTAEGTAAAEAATGSQASSGGAGPQALPRTLGDLVGTPLAAARQAAVARFAAALRGGAG